MFTLVTNVEGPVLMQLDMKKAMTATSDSCLGVKHLADCH